ncbi:Dabb family protein [Pseudomonas sp. R5(2019)]|uniref:Dabb family protein n=1 Tax=Pseudomonas sp. R5(2019) TaxID=2697566 RepID=UPI00141238AB|nr:Dabb family protein [Pseudomonas sp. R5(2019)]NBA95718.1 Dabb family protein [Pseudomonas sp. R5(2019)]
MQPVKHIVMWNLRGESEQERSANIQKVKLEFESIRNEIPGLKVLEIGVDISQIDYACDVVLYSEFESISALKEYASHPAHLRVRDALGNLRTHRYQVDYLS